MIPDRRHLLMLIGAAALTGCGAAQGMTRQDRGLTTYEEVLRATESEDNG